MKLLRAAGAAGLLLLLQACASQPLEKRHTVRLTEEYHASSADDVRSLEDYLRLEDRLFAELDAEVYSHVSPGPADALLRGESLNHRGYWVVGLRLPGHGTAPSDLLNVRWEDMAGAVRLGVARFGQKVGAAPIHLVGYSTGAPLAVDFALDAVAGGAAQMPASLVLVSPAIGIHRAAAMAAWKRR